MGVDHRIGSDYPRRIAARLCLLLLLAAILGSPAPESAAAQRPSHVFLVVLENREYDEVVGNPALPYFDHLVQRGAVATDYYAVAHPSLPNYLAILGGSTFGIAEDCTECLVEGPNLATQLSRAGISWRAYMEGLPYPCYTGGNGGGYGKRHDPFVYFPAITTVPKRCARVVPQTRLEDDLEHERLPQFAWLTPDTCHDGHDCPLPVMDYYLWKLVPQVTRQLGPHGLLILTFDEGSTKFGCCGSPGGGRVATVLLGPDVPHGKEVKLLSTHYSLLAAIEDRFGLPRLGEAAKAPPLAPALIDPRGLRSR